MEQRLWNKRVWDGGRQGHILPKFHRSEVNNFGIHIAGLHTQSLFNSTENASLAAVG